MRTTPDAPPGEGGTTRMPGPAAAASPAPETAARVLLAALAALALTRVAASLAPGTWAWGLASLRDVPAAAWALWALATLALVPPAGRLAARAMDAIGDAWTARPRRAGLAMALFALAAALFVAVLPDRGYFVGDFALRLGLIRKDLPIERAFPQALPLDVLLHGHLVPRLADLADIDPLVVERALGAVRAALLALLGVALARALDLRGAIAAAVAIGATATGMLGLDTGDPKGLGDLGVAVLAVAVAGLRIVRGRGGLGALGLATAAAILLHRSGYLLLAPWAVAAAAAWRTGRLRGFGARLALVLPFASALAVLPRAWALLTGFDRAHLAPAGGAAVFAPLHLADAANNVVWTAPLALAALALALARPRALARRAETPFLAALVLPQLALLLAVHPRQGMFRDWDVFAPAGVAVAAAAAAAIGAALAGAPRRRWLAPAVALAAIAPVTAQLLRAADTDRSLAWANVALAGPPLRGTLERSDLHTYRGIVFARDERYREGSAEFRRAAELVPSPTRLALWVDTAVLARDPEDVRASLAFMAERAPTPRALVSLSRICAQLGHLDEARVAAGRALEMAPGDSVVVAWARRLVATVTAESAAGAAERQAATGR